MFALFRFPFSFSVHLYIFKVTDGSSRHPHFAACIPDCFRRLFLVLHLVCLSKVYQRSLFFSASVFIGKRMQRYLLFFILPKFSEVFFEKVFFQGNRKDDFLAPLDNTKVRYLHSPKPDPAQNFSACRFSYLSPLSRKRLQRYSLFSFLQIL